MYVCYIESLNIAILVTPQLLMIFRSLIEGLILRLLLFKFLSKVSLGGQVIWIFKKTFILRFFHSCFYNIDALLKAFQCFNFIFIGFKVYLSFMRVTKRNQIIVFKP